MTNGRSSSVVGGPARRELVAALVVLLALTVAGCDRGRRDEPAAGTPPTIAAAATVTASTPSLPPGVAPAPGFSGRIAPPPPRRPRTSPPRTSPPRTSPPHTSTQQVPRTLFPRVRVVAIYGKAGDGRLGVLGRGTPEQAGRRVQARARAYRRYGRPVLPAFELIATIANRGPGPSGLYRTRIDHAVIERYLKAVRRFGGLLILDVQPGRGDFLREVRHYDRFLREPDVGIALDPEWSMGRHGVPGKGIGRTDAATVNRVSAHVAGIVRDRRLPQKLFIVHQFTSRMLPDRERIVTRRGLAVTIHVDGFGSQRQKRHKYRLLAGGGRWRHGFKLFEHQDIDMMTPAETMALRPRPDLVTYQ